MKIAVFEVSQDERKELDVLARTLPVSLHLEENTLSMQTISLAQGA